MNRPYATRTIILNEGDSERKRAEILAYFENTFKIDEHLFDLFADEKAMYMRADPLRHPLIFYFGHTATFFINKLNLAKIIDFRINPQYESMFAVGVDEMSWDDLNMSNYNWPLVSEVRNYRSRVFETVVNLIKTLPISIPICWESPFWVILMGIEHARIHLETSSVLIRQLPLQFLKPIDKWNVCNTTSTAPENELLKVDEGSVELGKNFDHNLYGWDNEYGAHNVKVEGFNASKYLCSNGEFLQFIDAGGYQNETYWTTEGWNWRTYKNAQHPLFWIKTNDEWKLRLVFNEIDMPWDWPVEVNYLEAKAFCNWKSITLRKPIRLPSEEEWYLLKERVAIADQPFWETSPGNINMEHYQSPCPVNQFAFGPFYDVIGNVWQWTETPINGFSGFKVHPFYDDFSTPTFDGRHNLIKGGSWISTGNEATHFARYAFRRHFYQHAGFRYIESENEVTFNDNIYETDDEVVINCNADYSNSIIGIPNFNVEIARFCSTIGHGLKTQRALDLGCKTGRSTFELARTFDFVTGLDFTARNIKVAAKLRESGSIKYEFHEEGEIVSYHEVTLTDLKIESLVHKVEFWQADGSNLKTLYSNYDLILLNDILDEMYDARSFLSNVHLRLNEGGMLVIASAYSWCNKPETTKVRIGGYREDGEPITAIADLERLLNNWFEMVQAPHVIQSVKQLSKRKFEVKNIEVSVWRKKPLL